MIQRLCVIGVGLIGGSAARCARGFCREIVGVDVSPENLRRGIELGVIDWGCEDLAVAAQDADFVLIATPVGAIEEIFRTLAPVWSESAVYTDVGSTKGSVVEAARSVFRRLPGNFVPGHPVAGAERSGVDAADPDLFAGKRVVLTPLPDSETNALQRVESFWQRLGARVSIMDVSHHDVVFAATSHLPHILAFTLVGMLGRKNEQAEIFQYAAGGFRDFTRIASSDARMWSDICHANRRFILQMLEEFQQDLQEVTAFIRADRVDALYTRFREARAARERFLQGMNDDHA